MSILQIQRRYAELYRIRLGDRTGNQPRSLDGEIRITSPNKSVIKAFADTYGGRGRRWSDGNGFQVYLPTTRLPIILLPGQNVSQNMEHWQGQTCQRRCDSVTMQDGSPCACGADLPIEDRICKPVTRLTVACPEVPAVGVGLLTTRSLIAAQEMDGQLSLAQPFLDAGRTVSAILRVDRLVTPGHSFVVPRIELPDLTFAEAKQLVQAQRQREIARQKELDVSTMLALKLGEEE